MSQSALVVYEEYASAQEKHAAQKGATRGQPTGKARGYIFVAPGTWHGRHHDQLECVSSVTDVEPGDDDPRGRLGSGSASIGYLREKCRRIGGCHLPPKWRERWNYYRTPEEA